MAMMTMTMIVITMMMVVAAIGDGVPESRLDAMMR